MGQALRDLDPAVELLFVGSSHGPEGSIAGQSGIPFMAVPSAPLTRSISLKNMASFGKLLAGVIRARRILKDFGPDVVIGTGGYTTAAVLLAAKSIGCKFIIHEQNAVPGRTNVWLSRLASKVCVTFDGSAAYLPKDKVVMTGMPIRSEFASLKDKQTARRELGLKENLYTILVVGGSQGAKKLNELVMDMWPAIDNGNTQIIHQVGRRNYDQCASAGSDLYKIEAYLDMPTALAASDLVISRSGASTIAEITAAALPSILVPYPYAFADHQKRNAQCIASSGAAIMCEEGSITKDGLASIVSDLRSSPDKLKKMADASASLAKIDAAKSVAQTAIEIAD